LAYYHIKRGCVIDLLARNMTTTRIIYRVSSGKCFPAMVDLNWTIKKLKGIIYACTDPEYKWNKLILDRQQLDDNKTLKDSSIVKECFVFVIPCNPKEDIQFYVQFWTSKTHTLHMSEVNTISELKLEACKRIGLKPGNHKLIFKDNELEDSKTLEYYNIDEESTVILTPSMMINIKLILSYQATKPLL
jgi:ubiquitin C